MQIKSHKSVEQIAKKHRMNVSDIQKQLDMGVPIEHEHTRDKVLATDIALQHLDEIPDYYTRLKKMEADAKKEHKKFKDVKEDAVTDLQRGLTELEDASYDSVDSLMRRIMKKRKVTAKQLHNDFVTKHKKTPDSWIKDKNEMKEEKGLWANIHARRKKGLSPKKPGQKGYPKTLDIEEGLKQARKNVGASKCWTGKKVGNPSTKIKNGKEVPNCVSVEETLNLRTQSEGIDPLEYDWHTPVRERADRYCPKCEKLEIRNECKYGTKYWDMFSLPAEIINSKKDYNITMPHPGNFPESVDHEYSMARSEISTIIGAAKRLKKKMGKGEGNLEAWVQSKITKAADYLDAAADYVDSGEMKKESVSIEDANGNHYVQFIDIVKPQSLKPSRGIGSEMLGEGPSFEVGGRKSTGMGAMTPQDVEKLKQGNPGASSKIDDKYQQIRKGINLPLAKKEDKKEIQVSHFNMKTFGRFMTEAKKSEMKCNSPKSEPVGNSLTGKSHVVKACEGGKEKLLRFGQRGVKGSPKKEGESKAYASRRNRFQNRHAKNIAKGKMSAAYWANKVKW